MARERRKGLLATGAGLFVLGLTGMVVALVLGAQSTGRTVRDFARAPVGCTTTLQFDEADVFTIYLETQGRFGRIDGDCAANGATFDRRDDDLPTVDLVLVDGSGGRLALADPSGDDYSMDGYVGAPYAAVRIPEPGTYRITVRSDARDVGVAIGRDPYGHALPWWLAGLGLAGMVALTGVVLFVLGAVGRRPRPEPVHGFAVGTNLGGYTPAGTVPPATMPVPPHAAPWSSLPPPPPPPPPGAPPAPDAMRAGTTLPPPPPPTH